MNVELPAGTVTFLFTDIEGSTQLLRELGARYQDALALHDRILRTAFEANGGRIVDTQGDAFFAAFPRARSAVSAAIAAQRALSEAEWPDGPRLRVRMGQHSGEPAVGPERYVGMGVHRASRICAAAHGGQILMSGVTRDLVEDDLPEGARLDDLGQHTLKDIERPERLHQIVVDDLPASFPPPRTETKERRRSSRRVAGAVAIALVVAIAVAIPLALTNGSARSIRLRANSVGFIDAKNNKVRSQVAVEAAPTSAAYGEGALWIANASGGTVSRVDPKTRTLRQTITVGSTPSGIAVGGGGVWVANHDDGTVSWINPVSNAVVKTITVGNGPTAVAYGFGSVWVTNEDDRTVTRIDTSSGDVTKTIAANAVGRGITTGGGYVWVTDEASRSVIQISPQTSRVVTSATVGAGPTGIAYGDGSLWVANSLDGTLSQVDARTLSGRGAIAIAGGPSSVAFGDGAVWVAAEFANRVVRIDPSRTVISRSIAIGSRPSALAVTNDGLWVAVQAAGQGHRGGRLVIVGGKLDSIDIDIAGLPNSASLLTPVYDGLTGFDRVGGSEGSQLVPNLAAAIPLPADGGTSYTFRLRPGLRYSDGRRVVAADFQRGLERQYEVGSDDAQFGFYSAVAGTSRCKLNRTCDLRGGVSAPDATTVTFRLTHPDPRFLQSLAYLVPIPPGIPSHDIGTKPIPSTGPYTIDSYAPGRLLVLVRNHYFQPRPDGARPDGYPDEIVYRIVGPKVGLREVLSGKADFTTDAPPASVSALVARSPQLVHFVPQQATLLAFLNVTRPPFNDLRVRRAINYAVDRGRMAQLHGALLAATTCQVVPPNVPGFVRYCPYTVDPSPSGRWTAPDLTKAKALLARVKAPRMKVVVWTLSTFSAEARYFVSLLHELGYPATLRPFADAAGYFGALEQHQNVQAGFAGWFGTQNAADMFAGLMCGERDNWSRFCDPSLDKQIAYLTRREPSDPVGTEQLAARLDRALVDKAVWVPYATPRDVDVVSRRLGNFQVNPAYGELLDQMWVR